MEADKFSLSILAWHSRAAFSLVKSSIIFALFSFRYFSINSSLYLAMLSLISFSRFFWRCLSRLLSTSVSSIGSPPPPSILIWQTNQHPTTKAPLFTAQLERTKAELNDDDTSRIPFYWIRLAHWPKDSAQVAPILLPNNPRSEWHPQSFETECRSRQLEHQVHCGGYDKMINGVLRWTHARIPESAGGSRQMKSCAVQVLQFWLTFVSVLSVCSLCTK